MKPAMTKDGQIKFGCTKSTPIKRHVKVLNLPALFALADFHLFSVIYAALSCALNHFPYGALPRQ